MIVGNIFAHRLRLNRWLLWFIMSFAGDMCSWIVLIACFLGILSNGFILFYIVPVTIVFAVAWAVVGMFSMCPTIETPCRFPCQHRAAHFHQPEKGRCMDGEIDRSYLCDWCYGAYAVNGFLVFRSKGNRYCTPCFQL